MDRTQSHLMKPNAQYNVAKVGSVGDRLGLRVRRQMFAAFMDCFTPTRAETVLDIGVTSEDEYAASNYFELLYPFKDNIVAAGLDDAAFLEAMFPGLRFVKASVLHLPFRDRAFDLVHSSAVLEHVGSIENQTKMIIECLRVARRGVCLTTPNRWFPVELHTQLPLVHWLPKPAFRGILKLLGYKFFAEERNLNLMSRADLLRIVRQLDGWEFQIVSPQLLGFDTNLVLFATRNLR